MSLRKWLRAANRLGKGLTRSQLIKQLGQPPGRITGNGKGGWKKRTGDRNAQRQRRNSFDTTSTPLAAQEAKKLDNIKSKINDEASLFGLEPTQIEHIADQSDSKYITEGAPGDPTNKYIVTESDARLKDKVKLAVGDAYGVTINPTQDSIKVVPVEYFDPIVDPGDLPGTDIRSQGDLDRFTTRSGLSNLQDVVASTAKRTAQKILRNAVPGIGTAMDVADTKQRFDEFKSDPNLINGAQLVNGAASTLANGIGDAALATGIGAPIAAGAEKVAGLLALTDVTLQGTEDYLKGRSTGQ